MSPGAEVILAWEDKWTGRINAWEPERAVSNDHGNECIAPNRRDTVGGLVADRNASHAVAVRGTGRGAGRGGKSL